MKEKQILEVRNQPTEPVVFHSLESIMANRKYIHGNGRRSKAGNDCYHSVHDLLSSLLCVWY